MFVKERKALGSKVARKAQKERPKSMLTSEGMAEDAKVDDGIRTRIKKGLKQLRKAREEEKAAKELQEEVQEKVEISAGASAEENLWKELDESRYAAYLERKLLRPGDEASEFTFGYCKSLASSVGARMFRDIVEFE